ncbi:LuxR C-terminal-related transcriptional regulator [Streptomyces sp. NPDC004539]|uniref:LuxR C-terminal-related transcriptional regulator n=1 Tax=Streptomyces sp. NPDC004539 TaxID=3154280 RepID=UPI0033B4AB8E
MKEDLLARIETYRLHTEAGRPDDAARAALDVATALFQRSEDTLGSGWLGRARRLLHGRPESETHGRIVYLLDVEGELDGPDLDGVIASARRVQELGRRHTSPTLTALGVLGEGRALLRQGHIEAGTRLLDEALLATVCGEVDPDAAGTVHAHLVAACAESGDVRRLMEWTRALTRWSESLPAPALLAELSRVHRAQLLLLRGDWDDAEKEATRVCEELAGLRVRNVGEAHYVVGEVRRLRGDLPGAESAYRHAHRYGRQPQPGLALLRLAQGRAATALASIRTAPATRDRLTLARLGEAHVEIALAAGDPAAARAASAELDEVAARCGTSAPEAAALHARGRLALAEGRVREALPMLRDACCRWATLDVPYDAARIRVLLVRAYRALGDTDAAALEQGALEEELGRLGVAPDSARGALTAREAEVLALVAEGRTNREVAGALVVSEKTVARHLSNIFGKLGLGSRTAAAAYAFEHGLAVRKG